MDEERRRLIASIPRVSDLDAHKENIQPRPKGRSIGSLATLSSADREAKLEEGHAKFQELLDSLDEQDDPLQIYIDYIDWTIQMYPQVQNLDSNLMSLLKSATDAFKDTLLYKNDLRYLKIWIEYAQWVEEPLDIFLYLRKHGIGQASALYYLEYAAYYEKQDK
jgi:checkpoint serine/threonine-protein kinase